MEENTTSVLIETLVSRGWCFRNEKELRDLIEVHIIAEGEMASVDSIESELLVNMDLRSVGGKWLSNDPCVLKRSPYLQGPKVLQIVSVRDICQSSIEACNGRSGGKRLLRFVLTDGHSKITAIEYSPIPSMDENIVPGTKLRLEGKVAVHSGILCLNPTVVAVLGGVVQELYEEWKMSKKYSWLSRSTLRASQTKDGDGPPPFEKLQIESRSRRSAPHHSSTYPLESTSKNLVQTFRNSSGVSDSRETERKEKLNLKVDKVDEDGKAASLTEKLEEKPSISDSRQKEVSEAIPVQNQAAAQKLLQKMSQSSRDYARGQRRGKGKQEEPAVFTLDEWERRKGEVKPLTNEGLKDINCDEEIARQLQDQLDLQDFQGEMYHELDAERIKMSMFNFERVEEGRKGSTSCFRGRGWQRRRGRGRGR